MSNLGKSEAVNIVKRSGLAVSSRNTVFSNINSGPSVWWLEPNNKKFYDDLYIILNDNITNTLYVFYVPARTFPAPKKIFYQRNDRDCSHIEIPTDSLTFEDMKSKIHFSEYLYLIL